METAIIDFGRYKGRPVCDVPVDYLGWAVTAMRHPPASIVMELKRRAQLHGTKDAIDAAAAVSALGFQKARRRRCRIPQPWLSKKERRRR